MELLQGWSDVLSRGTSGDDTSSCILDQLKEDQGGENYSSPDEM